MSGEFALIVYFELIMKK